MKIYVYAISKNEEKFVSKWVTSMKEADGIYVLDTGSTDNTIKQLKKEGVHIKQKKIDPWRFDVARNESLKLVPTDADICICTDLDEIIEPGWRKKLEEQWTNQATRARYNYNWSFNENNQPLVNFYIEKIHKRHGYIWTHPVHEVLTYTQGAENTITLEGITVNHYPDSKKPRTSYLKLLELSVEEDPEDDRNMHYLGREYMYYQEWEKSIITLKKHLSLKKALWKDERSASMRFISRCYKNLNDENLARTWLDKAMEETPYLRDPFVERALLEYSLENYQEIEKYCLKSLKIRTHTKSYINESFSWDETIYDLLSISSYYQNKYDYAILFVNLALDYVPTNERLLKNKELYEQKEG